MTNLSFAKIFLPELIGENANIVYQTNRERLSYRATGTILKNAYGPIHFVSSVL